MITNIAPKLIAQKRIDGSLWMYLQVVSTFELTGFVPDGFDLPHFNAVTGELELTLFSKFVPNGHLVISDHPVSHLVPLGQNDSILPAGCSVIKLTVKDRTVGCSRVTNVNTTTINTQNEPKDPSRPINSVRNGFHLPKK